MFMTNEVFIGPNGNFFLATGSNNLQQLYDEDLQNFKNDMDYFIHEVNLRYQYCSNLGIPFIQLIIPEKNSVLNKETGLKIPEMTHRLAYVAQHSDCYIPINFLRTKHLSERPVYLLGDTHLTTFGAARLTEDICNKLGYDISIEYDGTEMYMGGDLIDKIFKGNFYEKVFLADEVYINGKKSIADSLLIKKPSEGFFGTIAKFRNVNAEIQKKILVFGNSFFSTGYNSTRLTFFFSKIFSEFTFLWTPTFDEKFLCDESPDFVLCQTVERFLANIDKMKK